MVFLGDSPASQATATDRRPAALNIGDCVYISAPYNHASNLIGTRTLANVMELPSQSSSLTVSELNRRAKMLLETQLSNIFVEGEISNLSQPSSGHWYFSLKDNQAHIRCAMFRNRNLLVKIKPKSGMKVRVRGRVSLYEPRGDYQLIAEAMTLDGEGALQRQFEELKAKLAAEQLFAQEAKQALPEHVQHLAVISSPSGAAVHDIIHVLKRRNPSIQVTLVPSSVQGAEAPSQLIKALELCRHIHGLDAIIIGRGGGSLEDLWAFNDEQLARAIHAIPIPIVSAVGHEVDVSISDFVADYRAPTPSAAAEVLSKDTRAVLQQIAQLQQRLVRATQNHLQKSRASAAQVAQRLKHPGEKIHHWQQRTDICEQRLALSMRTLRNRKTSAVALLNTRLIAHRPSQKIAATQTELQRYAQRLRLSVSRLIDTRKQVLANSANALDIVSPLSTLKRGYAIARDSSDNIVKTVRETNVGDALKIQLHDGEVTTKVAEVSETPPISNVKGQPQN